MERLTKTKRIENYLRENIKKGLWKKGDILPQSKILAKELNASEFILREAMLPLIREGVLGRKPRVGTYVLSEEHILKGKILLVDISNVQYSSNGFMLPNGMNYEIDLSKTLKALEDGTPIKYVAYGDSITAFGDCTDVENNEYHALWVKHLKEKFPKANIVRLNRATGGDTAYQGVERLQEKVLNEKPDLVSIAFGMNDNNTISGIDQEMYADFLQKIIDGIRLINPNCEFIILSSFHPKENWFYNSHKMDEFTKTAQKVANKNNAAYVNVDKVMAKFFKIKGQSALLSNNINHPSDWGHWIYYNQLVGATF